MSSDTAPKIYRTSHQPLYKSRNSSTELPSFFCPPIDSSQLKAKMQNGIVNGNGERPKTPTVTNMSLTEYSTNPSPPRTESPESRLRAVIPEEFILPNGYPDVYLLNCTYEKENS